MHLFIKIDSFGFKVNLILSKNDALRKFIFLPDKWRVSVSKAGVFVSLGKLIVFTQNYLIGHVVNIVSPRYLIHDHFYAISAGGYCGLSNGMF